MIAFDFEYYKPDTVEDAVKLYNKLNSNGKKPIYYGGGTEFISMARMNNRYTEAVIDIKGIPECNVHEIKNNKLIMGSAITLTDISEANYFPLLGYIVRRIADHTIQDKITLGGNLMGTIIYRESILALLLSNCDIILQGSKGKRVVPISDICDKKIGIEDDEILIQVIVDERFLSLPYLHVKRTKHEKIDYPLITMAAIKDKNRTLISFSGLCEYPFRSLKIEEILNDSSLSKKEKIKKVIESIPDKILHDIGGSSEYRKFMLGDILSRAFDKFQEVG
ncbi:FAD binding domain-containing protein [Tissierella pigra]|uniref:FAD binding domain-containing protein n=1 Tax=Tissierella pigra TaxID=2607614 RepID=UPI001C11B6FB|nr:FAD binding domain-containing protein [Tissierella pigra]MBU5426817.1 FAD binding domain-containing protein [Tissierella pigra]